MTGEPMHTASKEWMIPEVMFSTERMPQLSITDLNVKWPLTLLFQLCSAHFTALQMKNSRRSASAINPVTMENLDDFHLQT